MNIDIEKDFTLIEQFINAKVSSYVANQNSQLVGLVSIGFQIDESSWLSIYFDKRENVKNDGEWTKHLEKNCFKLEQWSTALSQEELISVTSSNGLEIQIEEDLTEEHITYFGDIVKKVIRKLKKQNCFALLSSSPDCQIAIEDLSGQYAWIEKLNS